MNVFGVKKDILIPHEKVDQNKIQNIAKKIDLDSTIKNPIVVTEGENDNLLIIDGHHRFQALIDLGAEYIPVQKIKKEEIILDYWYHSFPHSLSEEMKEEIKNLNKNYKSYGEVMFNNTKYPLHFENTENFINFSERLYAIYKNQYKRLERENLYDVSETYVVYNKLNIIDIYDIVQMKVKLVPGITKFKVHNRIFNLNVPLNALFDEKNLNSYITNRISKAEIRYYVEPIIIIE